MLASINSTSLMHQKNFMFWKVSESTRAILRYLLLGKGKERLDKFYCTIGLFQCLN